jgi:hypothetical protein
MTFGQSVLKFLRMDRWVCDYDGKVLRFPYIKWAMWVQHPFFTWGWLKQVLFGDNRVLRFHNEECQRLFFTEGRMKEIASQNPKAR